MFWLYVTCSLPQATITQSNGAALLSILCDPPGCTLCEPPGCSRRGVVARLSSCCSGRRAASKGMLHNHYTCTAQPQFNTPSRRQVEPLSLSLSTNRTGFATAAASGHLHEHLVPYLPHHTTHHCCSCALSILSLLPLLLLLDRTTRHNGSQVSEN